MNSEKLQELRKLAEQAEDFRKLQQGTIDNIDLRTAYHKRLQAYVNALYESPATILQLLDEIERLQKIPIGQTEIAELKQEIERLKCCGNCRHMNNIGGYDYCYLFCGTNSRFDKDRTQTAGDAKCDKWEGV